ncbi:MAG: hypothetical protein C4516_10705 [Oxalobacter sp.]|nr:MAG: hypothetical protein C4516_10705 [Oxalobacter sp.]
MSTTIEDRVILLLRYHAGNQAPVDFQDETQVGFVEKTKRALGIGGHGFWERLGERTNISSKRWRKVYAREQRVTSDMLEGLARMWPHHAFWLTTGITDALNGHVAPLNAQTFPERSIYSGAESESYFRAQLELFNDLFLLSGVSSENKIERLSAAERINPMGGRWWDSPLCETAYQISDSGKYADLIEQWNRREEARKALLEYIRNSGKRPRKKKEKEIKERGIRTSPVLGTDPRTKHQDEFDLFYVPTSK